MATKTRSGKRGTITAGRRGGTTMDGKRTSTGPSKELDKNGKRGTITAGRRGGTTA